MTVTVDPELGALAPELMDGYVAALPVKATTAMRLAADPLADLWTTLPNPLAGAA